MNFLDKTGLTHLWNNIIAKIGEKAPKHEASTTDISEGSNLPTGVLYLVYED